MEPIDLDIDVGFDAMDYEPVVDNVGGSTRVKRDGWMETLLSLYAGLLRVDDPVQKCLTCSKKAKYGCRTCSAGNEMSSDQLPSLL